MGFGESIQSFFTNYVKFTGRARRSEYWFITLFLALTSIGATVIDGVLFAGDIDDFLLDGGWGPVGVLWLLAVLLPSIAVLVRRLHDSDKSAWWILIILVPLAGVIVLFVFTLLDSTPGENKHGPSPKEAVQ
jgi:uncharacterized membrane protein YhaH (DUF805 family)